MSARVTGATAGSAEGFARWVAHGSVATRRATYARLRSVLHALGSDAPTTAAALVSQTEKALAPAAAAELWLALAVLTATLPGPATVERASRSCRLDGPLAALDEALHSRSLAGYLRHRRDLELCDVQIVTDQVIVDLHNTATSAVATGIQRVARETALRWGRDHEPTFVGWHPRRAALVRLAEPEVVGASTGSPPDGRGRGRRAVLVPWRCTYVLPELMAELPRVDALHGLFRYSGNSSAAIGFDCVPLTVPETVAADAVVNGFASMLAGLAHTDRIAAISDAAASEYRGWRSMLAGTGLDGPHVTTIALPVQTDEPTTTALETAQRSFLTADLPMVLVVGSHEPRKNHLAVLHAAELLWRDGLRFSLLFIGGNAWSSAAFHEQVQELQRAGRPVDLHTAVPDERLWAAYRVARCTLFPSLNEGFGLPVAESLASGTPVITSNFGSMREIAAGGGALLVDPRNDQDIARAVRRLVTDEALYATLVEQARRRRGRGWDDYAREAWDYLVLGRTPQTQPDLAQLESVSLSSRST